jgi:hypothetical protein
LLGLRHAQRRDVLFNLRWTASRVATSWLNSGRRCRAQERARMLDQSSTFDKGDRVIVKSDIGPESDCVERDCSDTSEDSIWITMTS